MSHCWLRRYSASPSPRPFSGTFHNVGSSPNIVTAIKIKAGGGQWKVGGGQETCNTRGTNMCTRIFNRNLYWTEGIRGHYAFYDTVPLIWMRSLLFWYVTQRLFGNYRSMLPNIPRRRRSHLHRGESLQSRINVDLKVNIVWKCETDSYGWGEG
jgi:hypothetical protein